MDRIPVTKKKFTIFSTQESVVIRKILKFDWRFA